jgi:hypothetical protein
MEKAMQINRPNPSLLGIGEEEGVSLMSISGCVISLKAGRYTKMGRTPALRTVVAISWVG